MVQELLVVGTRPLPAAERPFSLRLGLRDGLEVHELIHPIAVDVGFEPKAVLSLTPADVKAQAVAAALASALGGVVYDDHQGRVSFDGRDGPPIDDLTLAAQAAFTQAHLAWLAIETAHREDARWRFELMEAVDPQLAAENDWSGVLED
ncbi:MAG: hypothetical protein IAE78_11240 [Myxococcus sp.]|nr:hypothetical protein [Myxococcus sp.]